MARSRPRNRNGSVPLFLIFFFCLFALFWHFVIRSRTKIQESLLVFNNKIHNEQLDFQEDARVAMSNIDIAFSVEEPEKSIRGDGGAKNEVFNNKIHDEQSDFQVQDTHSDIVDVPHDHNELPVIHKIISASNNEDKSSTPESQKNALTPFNPSNRPKPKVKPKPQNFLKAREKTWMVGPPVYDAPYPDEYVPSLTALKRPLLTRDPYSLPKPLWPQPHIEENNAILALAVNYKIINFVRFVGTLRRTGYSGDIVLAVSPNLDVVCQRFLKAMDVIAYPVTFKCNGRGNVKHGLGCDWHDEQDMPLPLAIIRHELYLSWAWKYSKQSRLLILDFRDTFFQRDPFESLEFGSFEQLLTLEHWPYKRMNNCPFNSGWVRSCWREEFKAMKDHPVLCSGSYFATRDGMIDMETVLLNEVRSAKCHTKGVPSDQGYVNYLYWAGRLPFATHERRGNGIVNTVGSLMGKRHGGSIGPLDEHWKMIAADGHVMDNDNVTWSAVVHQWDRFFDDLQWTVDSVLECKFCYESKHGHPAYSCKCKGRGCECTE